MLVNLKHKESGQVISREAVDAKELLSVSKEWEITGEEAHKPGTKPAGDYLMTQIEKAIYQLDPETGFTGGGLPSIPELAELLGYPVSAEERNVAWKAIQIRDRGNGQ